jgi:hypothetical protein
MVGVPDALDATVGRRNDVVEGCRRRVGQLHALEAGPQALHRVQLRGRRAAAPPPARTAGDVARRTSTGCGGRAAHPTAASPSARRASDAALPGRRSAWRCRVVGALLVVEGQRRRRGSQLMTCSALLGRIPSTLAVVVHPGCERLRSAGVGLRSCWSTDMLPPSAVGGGPGAKRAIAPTSRIAPAVKMGHWFDVRALPTCCAVRAGERGRTRR